jgi:hypothetical protein
MHSKERTTSGHAATVVAAGHALRDNDSADKQAPNTRVNVVDGQISTCELVEFFNFSDHALTKKRKLEAY